MSTIWTSENKVRPGLYLNVKGIPVPTSQIGSRGVVAIPLAMGWGDEITELLSTDLWDGKALAKVGCTGLDAESLVYRQALQYAHKAILVRTDTGESAAPAKAILSGVNLTATAKYKGHIGNTVSIKVTEVSGTSLFDVVTCVGLGKKSIAKDIQRVATITDLRNNEFVSFSKTDDGGNNTLVTHDTKYLEGGKNGEETTQSIGEALAKLGVLKWDTLAIMSNEQSVKTAAKSLIKDMRDEQGRKCQAVVRGFGGISGANHEGLITTYENAGYRTSTEQISADVFVVWVAGLMAGTDIYTSRTNHVVEGAVEIIGEGVPRTNDAIISALNNGYFILSVRSDGAIVVEYDINSLVDFSGDNIKSFSKNKVIRTLDSINNDIRLLAEQKITGKELNDRVGRDYFKGLISEYMMKLQTNRAIQDFDPKRDLSVAQGEDIDAVRVELNVFPVDAIEKIYMNVNVRSR